MKSFLLLCAGILFTLTPMEGMAAGAQDAAPPQVAANATNPVKPTAESKAKAKTIYQIDCAVCHNGNGDGKIVVPVLAEIEIDHVLDAFGFDDLAAHESKMAVAYH